jgi:drug/metabolite transporter (DMT)-like permease
MGLLGNTAYQIFFMTGLFHTSVANTSLLLASNPVLVTVIGALTGIERLTPTHGLGVAVAFTGVVMVLANAGIHLSTASLAGDIPILLAALCWAIYTVGVRRWAPTMSPLRLTALTLLTGTPGLLIAGLPAILATDWGAVTLIGWGGLIYSTLLALVLSYTLWNMSVAEVGPSRTAVYNCFIPVVAMLLAWATLGERPLPLQVGGAALIVGGVLLTRLLPARRVAA